MVMLLTFSFCFHTTHLTGFTKRKYVDLLDDFSDSNAIFIYYLYASSNWDLRYHHTWLTDLGSGHLSVGESHENKILLLSKKITSFTAWNKLLMKTFECWVCKQPTFLSVLPSFSFFSFCFFFFFFFFNFIFVCFFFFSFCFFFFFFNLICLVAFILIFFCFVRCRFSDQIFYRFIQKDESLY